MPQKGMKELNNKDHVPIGIYPADRKKIAYIQLDLNMRFPKDVIHHLLEAYDRKTNRMKEQRPDPEATNIVAP